MTGEQVKKYIIDDLGSEPRHDCKALAAAISDIAGEVKANEQELLELLLENKPINRLMTHSYGFHTANGREIIETLKHKYYEHENN